DACGPITFLCRKPFLARLACPTPIAIHSGSSRFRNPPGAGRRKQGTGARAANAETAREEQLAETTSMGAGKDAGEHEAGKAQASAGAPAPHPGKPWLKSYPANVPAEITPPAGSIGDFLAGICKQHADRPAFACMGKSISFGELERYSAAFG